MLYTCIRRIIWSCCCWSFVVDISQEVDLITSGQQSEGGNGLPSQHVCDPGPLIGQSPQSWPLIGWWWPVTGGQAPGLALSLHKEQLSILYTITHGTLRSCKKPDSSLYFEHKMIEQQHQWYPVIIWASIIRQRGAGDNESDCLIVLAI